MQTWRLSIFISLLAFVLAGTGCGDHSSFFRARNPFDTEAALIEDWKLRSKLKKNAPTNDSRDSEMTEADLPEPPPGPRNRPYFGQQEPSGPSLPFTKEKPGESSDSREVARTDSPVPPPAVPLSRKETVSQPRPAATGAVCYRCNGKGRHLTSLNADGRMITCEDCGGTGRR